MGEATPRAEAIGALRQTRGLDVEAIAALFTGEGHAPAPLDRGRARAAGDRDALEARRRMSRGDYPEWLAPQFEAAFGADAVDEGRALADRAPVDLRANVLKTTREKALTALAHLRPEPTPLSPVGLRIAIRPDGRGPALAAEPAYVKGLVEVQDEGSQLAALLTEAKPGHPGPRPLRRRRAARRWRLPRMMDNHGQVYATDDDGRRLAPIFERLDAFGRAQRAGAGPEGARGRRSPISRAAATSCSSMRPAPARARGGATPTPNGASAPARSSSGLRIRRDARNAVAFRQARRADRLCHLLGAAGRERGSCRRVSCPPRRLLASRRCDAGARGGPWPPRRTAPRPSAPAFG